MPAFVYGIHQQPDVCQVVFASRRAAFSGVAPAVSLVYPVRCQPASSPWTERWTFPILKRYCRMKTSGLRIQNSPKMGGNGSECLQSFFNI